jgi:hypothetical protein
MELRVEAWCAWSSDVPDEAAWRAWAQRPRALVASGVPEARFLPPLQRRRCDALARMMLHVSHGCGDADALAGLPVVFASRHGPIDTTVGLLADLAATRPLSPTRFSHSVHNTQLGLFSIWTGNAEPASAVSARENTFAEGFVEALALLQRTRRSEVLLVTGDIALPEELAPVAEERHGGYAVALRLGREPAGVPLRFELGAAPGDAPARDWPDAAEFVRWLLSDDPALRIARGGRSWTWSRRAA